MAYPSAVEQWRSLVSKYFYPEDVNKALWVINYESGGDPNIAGDGGHSIGLFQENDNGLGNGYSPLVLADPETNIRLAAQAVYGGRGWADWGENNLYNGQVFGALGNHPYPGDSNNPFLQGGTATPTPTPSPTPNGNSSNSGNGGIVGGIENGIGSVVNGAGNLIGSAGSAVGSIVPTPDLSGLTSAISHVFDPIAQPVKDIADAGKTVASAFTTIGKAVGDFATWIFTERHWWSIGFLVIGAGFIALGVTTFIASTDEGREIIKTGSKAAALAAA